MILAFIGALMFIFGAGDGSVPAAVIGAILVLLGVLSMDAHEERTRARMNRERYWAYGEEPDWAREREKHRGIG